MSKSKDKNKILKSREKQIVTYKGTPQNGYQLIVFSRNFADQKGVVGYIQSAERKKQNRTQQKPYNQ